MNDIYLIRHGLIDASINLDSDGLKLSNNLIQIFNDIKVDKIMSSEVPRCIETILPLAKSKSMRLNTYSENDFMETKPLTDALITDEKTTVICYRVQEINNILNHLELDTFTRENKNSAYEKIIHLKIENGEVIKKKDIPTGFKKNVN